MPTEAHMARRLAIMLWKMAVWCCLQSSKRVLCAQHIMWINWQHWWSLLDMLDTLGKELQDGEYHSLHEQVVRMNFRAEEPYKGQISAGMVRLIGGKVIPF
jgi:hypothetical protein